MGVDIRALADSIGYPAAALGILIESTGIPFPGEITLLAVAAYAAQGHLSIGIVILVAAVGAAVGGDLGYLIGRRGGRPFLERFMGVLHLNPSHLARSELFFVSYGDKAVFLARFVVGARTWGSMMAGMSRMPFWKFQIWSAAGGAAWAIVIGMIGYLLGNNWPLMTTVVKTMGYGGAALLAVILIVSLIVVRVRRRRT